MRKRSLLLHVMLRQGTSWYALNSIEYLLPPPHLDESETELQKMASDMIAAQHNCKGLLKFILPDDMVTVNLEVMTLTGVHIYIERTETVARKVLFLGARRTHLLSAFLKRVKETQGENSKEFLESILDQDWNLN